MKTTKKIIRKVLFTFAIITFYSLNVTAQFNSDAPWMKKDNSRSKINTPLTMNKMVADFEEYWLRHDKNKKGSGYKPFMRWEYHWRNNMHPDGTFITPSQIQEALKSKEKQSSKNESSSRAASGWEPLGPHTHTNTGSWSSGQGRVNFVYVDPNNANTIYVGTPAGGIWKSTDAGLNWVPLSDELAQIGVSGIVTDPSNSNIIYIATGDKDASDTYSVGILKSTNGGSTWNTTGLSFTNTTTTASDIYIHPTNSNILWVATSVGLFKTINAGANWSNVLTGNIKDIKLKPGDPNTIYAVSPTTFHKSIDGGTNFTNITSGLPANSGRLVIDVTPANSSYVYVLSADTGNGFQGLYRSTNSGSTFTKTASNTDIFESSQAWYDLALAVSRTDADVVFTGCLNIWKSTNGGSSFTQVNSWSSPAAATYTHADIHFLRYYNNKLYCGSDGGIYVSSNDGGAFSSVTDGLQIGQFYKISVAKQSSAKMIGGLQDNGGYAFSNNMWKNYYGADGMDTAVDPQNSNIYYGFIQSGGALYKTTDGGNTLSTNIPAPSAETNTATGDDGGNWVTPLIANSSGTFFAGYRKLYTLNSNSWVTNSNTTFNTDLENIAIDQSNSNNMFVSDGTQLYKSTNKGVDFTLVFTFPAVVKDIKVHSSNGSILYVVTQGTAGLVYQSNNGGTSFTSISTGLPSIGKTVIVHQAVALNPLYLGTTLGVYYRDDSSTTWTPFDTNLPNVPITDLEINYVDKNITAATYGRGVWRSPIATTVGSNIPTPILPLAAQTVDSPVDLSWTNPVSGGAYRLQISKVNTGWTAANGFTTDSSANSNTPVNYSATNLLDYTWPNIYTADINKPVAGNTYYWTVRSYSSATGVSSYSDVRSFKINAIGTTTSPEALNERTNENQISFFPNPANNILNIEFGTTNTENMEIQIFDFQSRLVLKERSKNSNLKLNTSGLKEGFYILKITGNNINKTQTIIITH